MPREGAWRRQGLNWPEGLRGDRQTNLKEQVFWKHPNIHSSMPKSIGQNSGVSEVRRILQTLSWKRLPSSCVDSKGGSSILEQWLSPPPLFPGHGGALAGRHRHAQNSLLSSGVFNSEKLVAFISSPGLFLQRGFSKFIFLLMSFACFFTRKRALRITPPCMSTCTFIIFVRKARPAPSLARQHVLWHLPGDGPGNIYTHSNTIGTNHSCLKKS